MVKTTPSNFFRAFTEGQTVSDGRTVTGDMIDQIVETFNTATYTPGVNIEHLSGFSPEGPFNRYGDVTAVKVQTDDITVAGKTEKRKALYAQVAALDSLVALAKSGQKPFPSVELTADYAGTKKIGLVGLAFTDNPASIATQKLAFSQHASVNGNLIAKGDEAVTLEFAEPTDPAKADGAIAGFFNTLAAKIRGSDVQQPKEEPKPKEPANDNAGAFATLVTELGATVAQSISAALAPIAAAQTKHEAEFAALKTKLEATPDPTSFSRTPSTGGGNGVLTDC
jgi:hypothetical protein